MIEISKLAKVFANDTGAPVLGEVDLSIADNEFVVLLGRSGCGKTTLLNLIAGLETPSGGELRVGGKKVTGPGAGKGMVFQQGALFPWLTAKANIAFAAVNRGVKKEAADALALELLALVGLAAAAEKYPFELSGGMQQRVAIARALVTDPSLLLADEPTGNLDTARSHEIMALLTALNRDKGLTVVMVTHEADMAAYARRVVRLVDGLIASDTRNDAPAGAPEGTS